MYTKSPIIERYAAPQSWVAVGVAAVSLGVGIWQGQQKRKDQKKSEKKAEKNIDAAYTLQQKQAKINQLKADLAQTQAIAGAAIADAEKRAASSGDNTLMYVALGVGAIALLRK